MTGVLIKRENLDTGTDNVKRHRKKMALSKPRNICGCQKLGERPGTVPSLDL